MGLGLAASPVFAVGSQPGNNWRVQAPDDSDATAPRQIRDDYYPLSSLEANAQS